MPALYPEIEPCDHGLLDAGDGNLIYWEACGSPMGRTALVLHGGPESELVILPHASHSTANPDMSAAIVAATDRFRDFPQK